ncbi:MAG TPA: hypothetical protein VFM69_01170 [Pricia sp.]|nr:hypothetical protein [Pricia sp.]
MRNTVLLLFLAISLSGMAQKQLNDYKYIIVPKKFEDFKRKNQYQTSTLVKYLFTEKGFDAVYGDELPQDLKNNGCLGLHAKLVDDSSLFTTKTRVVLENCSGQEVFATKEGKSKEKDFKESYGEALRESFTSFDTMDYSYNGKAENSGVTVNMENDVKQMNAEDRREHTSVNRPDEMVEQEATLENQRYVDRRPVESDLTKGRTEGEKSQSGGQNAEDQQNTGDGASAASNTQRPQEKAADVSEIAANVSEIAAATLYAQELSNGYQLVDSTPKIRMKIHKTSMPDFYIAEAEGTNGVLFQKDGTWFFEYYSGDKLMTEELDVKF